MLTISKQSKPDGVIARELFLIAVIGLFFLSGIGWGDWLPLEDSAKKPAAGENHQTNIFRIFFSGAVRQFQIRISPIDGPRCNFTPTCSEYARQSIARYGVTRGIFMASDRLQRCNYCAARYYPIHGGRLLDPPSANVFRRQSAKE